VRDQVGSPTYTWHLAYGIVRLIEGIEFGIHHMAAAGACSWYDFAREIFEQAQVECRVLSATTEMLGRPAPRPPYSALASQREHAIELPSWRDGLAAYLSQRATEREAAV
jgi:dTDP-4-dehydrorhamnose reductase